MNKFTFEESFLEVGDIILKKNGEKYQITDQTINHYAIKRFLQPSEVIKVIVTKLAKVNVG